MSSFPLKLFWSEYFIAALGKETKTESGIRSWTLVINLAVWFVGLWNCFVAGMWQSLLCWATKAIECWKQSFTDTLGAERNAESGGPAH